MLTLSEAAEQLGISRAALDNWIKRLEIEKKKKDGLGSLPRRLSRSENSGVVTHADVTPIQLELTAAR